VRAPAITVNYPQGALDNGSKRRTVTGMVINKLAVRVIIITPYRGVL